MPDAFISKVVRSGSCLEFISNACMRYRRGRPGKASRYALRASRSVVVSLSLSRRNTTSESEETANQPLSQLR